MERGEIDGALAAAEQALAAGDGLKGTGFWKAVAAVKLSPDLVEEYADRIGRIDREAFERWALLTVPVGIGTGLMIVGTVVGLGLVWAAYSVEEPWNAILLLLGTGVTMVTTHGLAHQVVGRLQGMRFVWWFIGSIRMPQPGVKTDYATYLRVPARSRAWMHASGAIVTKLIPFLALGPALVIPVPTWATVVLVVVAIGQVLTDVLWSTKASDWKKFRREMSYAR